MATGKGFEWVIMKMGYDIATKAVDIDMSKCKFCQSTGVARL